MLINQTIIRVTVTMGLLAVNIMLNNTVDSALLGTVNGLGMTFKVVGRYVENFSSTHVPKVS